MPGWKVRLTEEEIWDLVNFIKSLQEPAAGQNRTETEKH